jgi:hypothetical protein
MSDYTEHGAIPIEDAAVDDPPTVDEVLERQRRRERRSRDDDAQSDDDQPDDDQPGGE